MSQAQRIQHIKEDNRIESEFQNYNLMRSNRPRYENVKEQLLKNINQIPFEEIIKLRNGM